MGSEEGMAKRGQTRGGTSWTASVAARTEGKAQVATLVGSRGINRNVASVTMPSVPSAPMKSLVVSNPVADLRARERVLMTSPDGRTTVCRSTDLKHTSAF